MKTNRLLMISSLLTLSAIACSKNNDQNSQTANPTSSIDQKALSTNQATTNNDSATASNKTNEQVASPMDEKGNPTQAAMNETPELTSSELLGRIHRTNIEEERMGKLALERGNSKFIKEYGKTLISDHAEADQKVTAMAKEKNIVLVEPIAKTDAEAAMMKKHQDLMVRLNGLKGKDFDKAFLEGMKVGHQNNIHMLETVQVDDPEMKSLVSDLLPTLRKHYRMSIDIVQDLSL